MIVFNEPRHVRDLADLQEILKDGEGPHQFRVQLNKGAVSSKLMTMEEDGSFWILNLIDDTEQTLTAQQLLDPAHTIIGEAIAGGAFVWDGPA